MLVYVNGRETDCADGLTVTALISDMGLDPNTVVVEHNLNILKRENWPHSTLQAGDRLEVVAFVGGG